MIQVWKNFREDAKIRIILHSLPKSFFHSGDPGSFSDTWISLTLEFSTSISIVVNMSSTNRSKHVSIWTSMFTDRGRRRRATFGISRRERSFAGVGEGTFCISSTSRTGSSETVVMTISKRLRLLKILKHLHKEY